nr:hypothetical protein [Tanacetum cinerariifolium]
WRDDTDDEPDDQELEAHYMYMAQIQEGTPDAADNSRPIFDSDPLQKVSNNDNYNVFAIESQHPEQSKSVNDTYPIEQDAHNVIIDSLDMRYDREQVDHDDDDDLANEQKKKELFAHQDTISIMSQEKAAQIKFYKTREDREIDKVIALENKVKVLDNIVYKTGQSVQTMNMLNPPESDEVIRLEKESRLKLSDLIRPFDYEKLNNLYDLFVPQRKKSSAQRYFSKRIHFLDFFNDPSIIREQSIAAYKGYRGGGVVQIGMKSLCGSKHKDANEHIEKVLEIVDLFHIPNITQDQIMLLAFLVSLTGAASRWLRNEPSGSILTWEVLKSKFPSKYYPPARTAKKMKEINNFQQEPDESLFRAWERFKELLRNVLNTILQICRRAAGPGFYQQNSRNSSYLGRRQTMKESLTKFMIESAKRHEENSNIIKETRAFTDAAIRNQGASIKTLEIHMGQMSKVLQERGFESLPSSTETNPMDHVKLISTAKCDSTGIRHIESGPYTLSDSQISTVFFETISFPMRLHNYCSDE